MEYKLQQRNLTVLQISISTLKEVEQERTNLRNFGKQYFDCIL